MTPHTHYDTLQVSRNASAEVIRAAYRQLSQKSHPDRHPETERAKMEKLMQRLNVAYETLSDPVRREAYDAWIRSVESRTDRCGDTANEARPCSSGEPVMHVRATAQIKDDREMARMLVFLLFYLPLAGFMAYWFHRNGTAVITSVLFALLLAITPGAVVYFFADAVVFVRARRRFPECFPPTLLTRLKKKRLRDIRLRPILRRIFREMVMSIVFLGALAIIYAAPEWLSVTFFDGANKGWIALVVILILMVPALIIDGHLGKKE